MISRLLRQLRGGVVRVLAERVREEHSDNATPVPSSVFARDVLCALANAGLSPDDATRALRPFEVVGGWLGPYTVLGTRQVEVDPVEHPGICARRRVRLLHRDSTGIPAEVPVLLAALYAAETETRDLPEDLDRAWKEAIRVAFVTSERCVWDAWVEREPTVEPTSTPESAPEPNPSPEPEAAHPEPASEAAASGEQRIWAVAVYGGHSVEICAASGEEYTIHWYGLVPGYTLHSLHMPASAHSVTILEREGTPKQRDFRPSNAKFYVADPSPLVHPGHVRFVPPLTLRGPPWSNYIGLRTHHKGELVPPYLRVVATPRVV